MFTALRQERNRESGGAAKLNTVNVTVDSRILF